MGLLDDEGLLVGVVAHKELMLMLETPELSWYVGGLGLGRYEAIVVELPDDALPLVRIVHGLQERNDALRVDEHDASVDIPFDCMGVGRD